LFCSPAGHARPEIAEAVHKQLLQNSYTPPFQLGHPGSFELARKVAALLRDSPDLAAAIGLEAAPHYTTLQKASRRLLRLSLARSLLRSTLDMARKKS